MIPRGMSLHGFADDHSVKQSFHAGGKNENLERKNSTRSGRNAMKMKHWMDIN